MQHWPDTRFDPLLGVGIGRTFFFSESLGGGTDLQLSNTWGFAAQVGIAFNINPRLVAGIDIRYIQIEPNASVNGAPIGTVNVDPLVFGGNIGYRF